MSPPPAQDISLASDRAEAVALMGDSVSRETWERLDRLAALLQKWQRTTNLVAPSTLPYLWTRHIADSLQLLPLLGDARTVADFGSGGGFPGLVIAAALAADTPGAAVHLIESNAKKAAFLREAARSIGLPAHVHAVRIEQFVAANRARIDIVTARALAPLDTLLAYANPLLKTGARALFLKGQDVAAELTLAAKYWSIEAELVPSKTDPHGRIVVIRRAEKL